MPLIIGLGNPGKKFILTRHNVGFMILDKLREKLKAGEWKPKGKFKALISPVKKDLLLAKPQTFMNASGLAVAKLRQFYKLKPKDIWVIHDDLDIALGKFKIQFAKGPKFHKGLKSIEDHLKSQSFWRLRIGIEGRIVEKEKPGEDYVLENFNPQQKKIIDKVIEKAIEKLLIKI